MDVGGLLQLPSYGAGGRVGLWSRGWVIRLSVMKLVGERATRAVELC